jgi:hypothetical protein
MNVAGLFCLVEAISERDIGFNLNIQRNRREPADHFFWGDSRSYWKRRKEEFLYIELFKLKDDGSLVREPLRVAHSSMPFDFPS